MRSSPQPRRVRPSLTFAVLLLAALGLCLLTSRGASAQGNPAVPFTGQLTLSISAEYQYGGSVGTQRTGFNVTFMGTLQPYFNGYAFIPAVQHHPEQGQFALSGFSENGNGSLSLEYDQAHSTYIQDPDLLTLAVGTNSANLSMFVPTLNTSGRFGENWQFEVNYGSQPLFGFLYAIQTTTVLKQTKSGKITLTTTGSGSVGGASGSYTWSVTGSFKGNLSRFIGLAAEPPVVDVPPDGSPSDPVTFTAFTDPADAGVSWSGDLGLDPQIQGHTLVTHYGTPGVMKVTASLSGGGDAPEPRQASGTTSATAKTTVFKVHWEEHTSKGWQSVDTGFRIPISQPVAKTQHVEEFLAVVDPESAAKNVKLDPSGGVNLVETGRKGARIEFTLEGTAISQKSQQTGSEDSEYVNAHDEGYGHNEVLRGRVLIPFSIAKPHDVTGGGLVHKNFLINNTTSPTLQDSNVKAPKVGLVTILGRYLTIKINDQFGDPIGTLYDGAAVTENGSPLNVTLKNGQYEDGVFVLWPDDVNKPIPVEPSKNSPTAKAWPSAPQNVIPRESNVVQSTAVEVDGIRLSDGIQNRQVQYVFGTQDGQPATVGMTIDWP